MMPVFLTAAEAACGLGNSLDACESSLRQGRAGLRPLGDLMGTDSPWAALPAGWIADRSLLQGRRYGAASNAAAAMAHRVVERARWSPEETAAAWIFAGSSRGNAMELLGKAGFRRPLRAFAASNAMHSEIGAAVSIELGIRGPWQVLANGCAAGLDALGMAWMAVASGSAPRALVVAVDLPLVPELLRGFQDSRLLSTNGVNDPFSVSTTGFLPAEAAVAVALERRDSSAWCEVRGCTANSDAWHSLALPPDGRGIRDCLSAAWQADGPLAAICPHATGTREHGEIESRTIHDFLTKSGAVPTVHLMKPWTGHTLGASGLLDVALLAAFLRRGELPPNLPGLAAAGLRLPESATRLPHGANVLKIASGMGGHNAAVWLRSR
ncbi:MAG: hypothetical protein KA004_15400 [Verrucomicrobiales bacterium]|nr:hypothetical protein [Verrucomicrobiales bacterium]